MRLCLLRGGGTMAWKGPGGAQWAGGGGESSFVTENPRSADVTFRPRHPCVKLTQTHGRRRGGGGDRRIQFLGF